MSDRWAADIIEAIRGKNDGGNGGASVEGFTFATVSSVDPLSIMISGQVIKKHLHINALLLRHSVSNVSGSLSASVNCPSGSISSISVSDGKLSLTPDLKAGDSILVMKYGVAYYVIAKMVAA